MPDLATHCKLTSYWLHGNVCEKTGLMRTKNTYVAYFLSVYLS